MLFLIFIIVFYEASQYLEIYQVISVMQSLILTWKLRLCSVWSGWIRFPFCVIVEWI